MKRYILLLFLFPLFLFSQEMHPSSCGTSGFAPHLLPHHHLHANGPESHGGDKIFLLKFHIVRDDNGVGGLQSDARIRRAIAETNTFFAGSGIQFALCGSPVYYDSSTVRYGYNAFVPWAYQVADPRYINVFETLANPGFPIPVSAYASFPGGSNRIVTFGGISGRVLAHELGHNLGLYHTFGNGVGLNGISAEWVNGGNCTTTGDEVCDTPADPYTYGNYNSCAYDDTLLRDANGDLYMPDLTNIMSYYPCQTDHFSPGQHQRMLDTYAQERFYMMNVDSSQFARLEGVPQLLCVGESLGVKLSAYPAGGTFSGAGVVGDSLIASNLLAGEYEITYHLPPATQVAPYSKTDAVQSVYYGTPYQGDSLWLGFRAGESAPLDAIRIRAQADSQRLIHWRLLSGIGLGGSVLHSQTDTLPADSLMRWYRFALSNPVMQQAGQRYTLAFAAADSFRWETASTGYTHPQERSSLFDSLNSFRDRSPCFATEITSTQMLCHGDSISYRFVVVEPLASYWEPEDRFCLEERPISMGSFFSFNADAYFQEKRFEVNGQSDTLIRPGQLGPGMHDIALHYKDYNGCNASHEAMVTIYDTAHIVLQETFCESDSAYSLQKLWPQATFSIQGTALDSLFPAALGAGRHQLQMHLPNVYDSLRLVNLKIPLPGGQVRGIRALKGSEYWQAFWPDTTAHLGEVYFQIVLGDSAHFAREVYRGLPGAGQLLWSDSSWLYLGSWRQPVAQPALFSVPVEKDSLYSVRIIRLDSVGPFSTTGYANVIYDSVTTFPRGTSHLSAPWGKETNFYFEVELDFQLGCGEDKSRTIEIFAQPTEPVNFLPTPDSVFQEEISKLLWDKSWADSLEIAIQGGTCLNCGSLSDSLHIRWDSLGWVKIVVLAQNKGGCLADSVIRWVWVKAKNSVSIDEFAGMGLQVFPNPFSEKIRAKLRIPHADEIQFILWDMYGKVIWQGEKMRLFAGEHDFLLAIPSISSGIYALEIRLGKSKKVLFLNRQ